jgi:hypothetical protein
VLKSYIPEISNFRWAHSPLLIQSLLYPFPLDLHQLEIQWWIFFIILQATCLKDFNLWIISFGLEDSSDWNFSVYSFPASGARSRSGSNSGNVISWGFGFLLCWLELLMRHFTIIPVVLNFSNCGFLLYSVYPLSFWDKKGEYFLFWTGNVFPNRSSVFLSRNSQRGSLLVFYIGNILVDKKTLCNGCFLIGLSILLRVFK